MSRYTIVAAALVLAACNTTDETVDGQFRPRHGRRRGDRGRWRRCRRRADGGPSGPQSVPAELVLTSGGYTDVNGVYHRYDRYGYYAANGAYIPYNNARGAYCARWNTATNTCVWWLTG